MFGSSLAIMRSNELCEIYSMKKLKRNQISLDLTIAKEDVTFTECMIEEGLSL
jgi:hypothetical protein